MGWIGVDFDGTLASKVGWRGIGTATGKPKPDMVDRVKHFLASGVEVRIFTARACVPGQAEIIAEWCKKHIGQELPVTNIKDLGLIEIWDDNAIPVDPTTGRRLDEFTCPHCGYHQAR